MTTQADDYRHCVAIYYPGFSSLHPSPLPMQSNKYISLSQGVTATLASYDELLLRYGIRVQLPRYLKAQRMRNFVKDAFWWMFLEHFVSVDLEVLLQQVKGNTLVSDEDMKAFQFDTVVATHIQPVLDEEDREQVYRQANIDADIVPTLPILRRDANIGAPTRHRLRDVAKKLPSHLVRGTQLTNRTLEDVTIVGSPRCASALSMAEAVESRPQSATRTQRRRLRGTTSPGASGLALSLTSLSSSEDEYGDGYASDASSVLSTVSGALRVTTFSNSRALLHKLPLDVRLQIAAKEQHQLFTRMSLNYGALCNEHMGLNVGLKDAITRILPEVLSQLIFFLFAKAIPFATKLLDIPFQISLGQKLSFWIGGVERIYNVRAWGIHAYLDPVKRHRKQSRTSSVRRSASSKTKDGNRSGNGSYAPAPPSSARTQSTAGAPVRILSFTMGPRMTNERSSDTASIPAVASGREHSAATVSDSLENSKKVSDLTPSPRNLSRGARSSDAPSARRSDWSAPAKRSDAPPLFTVGDGTPILMNDGTSSPTLRSAKSMRRVPGGPQSRSPRVPLPGSPPEDALAKKKDTLLKQDMEAMKQELNKFKTTHTFAQFHYSGHMTRQVPTFRDADVEVDVNSGKLQGVEERLPSRIAQAFVIGPKKRNVQVIKKDLESKFLSTQPWYAGKNQKIFIKDTMTIGTKFATNNWSPLLHRFMLTNGEDNLRPLETMNWTL